MVCFFASNFKVGINGFCMFYSVFFFLTVSGGNFKVFGASLERVLTVREEIIEKFIDAIENERFQNRDFTKSVLVSFGKGNWV